MPIGDPYATVADLEGRLGKSDDGTFTDLIDAASTAIELFTRRQFNRVDVAAARRFEALDRELLPVDDFWTVTDLAIDVDGTGWTTDEVDPRPWNGIVNGQPGHPFFELFAVEKRWPLDHGPFSRPVITITAKWGWESVPTAIKLATLDVAAAVAAGGGAGPVRSESIDGYSVSYATSVLLATANSGVEFGPFARAAPYRHGQFGIG